MINPALLAFLRDLENNNNREWFQAHKDQYKVLHDEFAGFLRDTADQVAQFDPAIRERITDSKTVKVFRIYNDVRFAKGRPPYKTNFGGVIAAGDEYPAYYLHIEAGNCFAGGGIYMPAAPRLLTLREKVDREYAQLRRIVDGDRFRAEFPDGLSRDAMLKTAPRGYSADHPAIDLLRLKSFTAGRSFSDREVVDDAFAAQLLAAFAALSELNAFLAP
jgi:uncharacterized protein (TIGR02453 family)